MQVEIPYTFMVSHLTIFKNDSNFIFINYLIFEKKRQKKKGNRRRSIGYCPHLCKSPLQPFQPAQQSPRL